MKRYLAFDFIRGLAIIGVLGFHMLNVVYNYKAALANDPPIPFYLLIIVLYWVGQFDILFLVLSGAVNTISIDNQWNKFLAQNPTAEDKKSYTKKIMKTQVIRGLFIYLMSYVSESLMNSWLLAVIIQEENPIHEAIGGFYYTNILQAIALGTILSGVIYTKLLAAEKDQNWMVKRMLIWVVVIFLVTPAIAMLSRTFPQFYDDWKTRSFGLNFLYFFLNPIFRARGNCFFPYAATSVIGAMIGCRISSGKITKNYVNKVLYISLILFAMGFVLFLLKVLDVADSLDLQANTMPLYFLNSLIDLGDILMVTGGSLIALMMMLYLIDIRGKAKNFAKYTVSIRRFGLISLTIFATQWILAVLLIIYHNVWNLLTNSAVAFRDGPFFNGNLTGWATWGFFFISLFVYHVLLWSWGKVNFTGSFEWMTVKLLSRNRKDAGERLNLSASLFEVESPVIEGQEFYGLGTRIGLWIMFFTLGLLYVALNLL